MEDAKGIGSIIPKATFTQVVNHPLTWAFIIITMAGMSSFYLYVQAHKETVKNLEIQIQNCEQEVQTVQKRSDELQKQRDRLYDKLLFNSGYGDSIKTKQ